jgi:hypothetical protein
MIIKKMDSKQDEIRELEILLKGDLQPYQRFLIDQELRTMKSGLQGEKDSAYYIDFYFGDSKNWAVIHDLRIEHKSQVAQIDHLLMNRFFEVYVLESKNYSYKLKIGPGGEFEAYYKDQYFGIPSPVEQNKRHVHLLERFLKDHDILPKRMGLVMSPKFRSLILISPKSVIIRPPEKKFDTGSVIKADALRTKIDEVVDKATTLANIASIGKVCSSSTLAETAKKLAAFHRPLKVDYRKRFGLTGKCVSNPRNEMVPKSEKPKRYLCAKCKKVITEKEAKVCLQNRPRFKSMVYCWECQKGIPMNDRT